ncbi:Protein bark beetle [Armadillidium nasatum]|uniref:Protein bark beetle n=1 Tax=Armadillidium nasatum TaxID=96803 RepID=A0A5N5T4R1_9CRUS|nr:Protein bark beetle [Armadillidium nasatum]
MLPYLGVSRSTLKYVRIEYAGMGPQRDLLAAVMSWKVPPRMNYVTVTKNSYTGVNFTLPDTFVSISRSVITENGGIGIYVNTSIGSVSVDEGTIVSDNFGDGIKYNLHHKEPDLRNSEQFLEFCSGASNPGQIYPLIVVAKQIRHSYQEERCRRKFFTSDPHLVFTINFVFSQVDKDDSASIEVRDRDQYGVLLTKFSIRNNTVVPSVVSRTNSIYVTFTAQPGKQVVSYMQVFAHEYKIPDISVNNSVSERNVGHGVSVDNMQSLVLIHKSNLTDNIYGSGLNVRGGSGDVNVTYSTITNNIGDGVNVTYEGGVQNVTWSVVANNVGRGVAFWYNESGHDTKTHQETGVAYTTFTNNLDVGLLVGNFCREAIVNVSTNLFLEGNKAALQVDSCWRDAGEIRTLLIGHNSFIRNNRLAISIAPAVKMNLSIFWNEFHENKRGTLKIYNEDLIELEKLPTQAKIFENTFSYNSGIYVMLLTLNLRALDQYLFVTRNTIKNNFINEAYKSMASRSKPSGVVCIGSFNIELYRNLIENPRSLYELSSLTLDQSTPINATFNWLGSKDEVELFDRVFDRRDRYTLAVIEFHPFLLSNNNMDTPVVSQPQYSEPEFFSPKDDTMIGGEVNGNIVLTKNFYNVVRDIYVQDTGILTIPFGTTLEFSEGIGLMVTGTLRTEGAGDDRVRFTLSGTTEKEKIKALIEGGHIDELPENMTSSNKSSSVDDVGAEDLSNSTVVTPEIPVKLAGGKDDMEGRLMVFTNGVWGTVCDHGFKEEAAAIACQQMGYVLNPEDWFLEAGNIPSEGSASRIVRSNVRCDEFDTDFLQCEYDSEKDIENSCTHKNDVGIRCYPRTWAGIRFGMTAKESHMKGVIVEKAGLLDYSKRQFKPALQVDFNQHVLQDLIIQDNSFDGLGIIRSNQYAISNPESRLLRNCIFRNNRRHGVSFAQLGTNITSSKISDNKGSGIHFNPFVSREQQRELAGWLNLRSQKFVKIPAVGDGEVITLIKDLHKVFATQNYVNKPDKEITFTVNTTHSNVIGIQILNPISPQSSEQLIIYDYQRVIHSKDVSRWNLRKDLSVFPTTSSSYAITIHYSSGSFALGDAIFVLTAVEKRDIAQDGDLRDFRSKVPMLFVQDSSIMRNTIGLSSLHYDRYLTDDKDHLLRNGNETIAFIRSNIVDSKRQAVFTLSPFREAMDNDRIGEITFMFNDSKIAKNGRGIDQFSWDMRESNNLFHWIFDNLVMEGNGGGGISLSLPYVWQYNENFTHTVFMNKSKVVDNADFEFTVDGHFARVNISLSKFVRNVCSKGVLSVRGMEKEMFIYDNIIEENVGLYMAEFKADSQSEILGNVLAYFNFNTVQKNRHPPQSKNNPDAYLPASAAIAVRGLQRLNITYNLFGDNEMDYELLAGLFTGQVETDLNVQANWWGSREVSFIQERIFDFDDWNNYAIASFRPFLIESRFDSPAAGGIGRVDDTYIKDGTLGGRLTKHLLLKYQEEPYIVTSDLTVMPGVILRIEPGVTLEFYPSVGILVLGKLEAIGRRGRRITMRPVDLLKQTHYRVGRQTFPQRKIDVRLCVEGDCERKRSGFLDIYNSTTQQWVPMCDDRFSERNAQVVCSQLGYNRVNIFYARDKRIEMYPNALTRIRSWPDPIQCQGIFFSLVSSKSNSTFIGFVISNLFKITLAGTEKRLEDCPIRMNGQIYDHRYECQWNGDFVYISCGEINLPGNNYEYWGGVRFSIPDFEFTSLYERIHDTDIPHTHYHTHDRIPNPSILAWVDIMGAGILHNEKSPAILSFYETPKLLDVSVTHCAYDGVTFVSAHDSFEMLHSRFEQNLGVGVSLIGLTGETRETVESSFTPVKEIRLPYNMFGMVDICDSNKELIIQERVLLYYKYDNKPIDCVKIFSSAFDVKKFGFRLLQFNLFNLTSDPMLPDRLILYDGDIYNETTPIISTLDASTVFDTRFFKTKGTRLSVQLHATGASGYYGFVAEVVTLPISTIGLDRDLLHNMTYNQFYNNQDGAIFAVTAGEVNPWLAVTWSRIEDNGLHLYGNITTTDGSIKMDLQNMRTFYFKNNLVRNNTGGLHIMAGSNGAATKLLANITNNLFENTQHRPSLYMEAKERSAYQEALIAFNDFSWAYIPYHDVITLAQIVTDFSYNYVHSNLGRHILDIYGFEKVRLPVYQTTSHNSFAKNKAVDPAYPGTVVAGSAGQQYVDNVFYNLDNAYEMIAVNESV